MFLKHVSLYNSAWYLQNRGKIFVRVCVYTRMYIHSLLGIHPVIGYEYIVYMIVFACQLCL